MADPTNDTDLVEAIALERTVSGESWQGVPVVAYHWRQPSGFSPPSSTEVDCIAYHWSTGPKDAEPLVRLKDILPILYSQMERVREEAAKMAETSGSYRGEGLRRVLKALAEDIRQISVRGMAGGEG